MDPVEQLIAQLQQELPAIFLGAMLDELTGHAVAWGTTQNRRSRGEIPNADKIFIRLGNRTLIARNPFLAWLESQLRQARRPLTVPPPRRTRRAPPAGEPDRVSTR
jgi:hypothetical protein